MRLDLRASFLAIGASLILWTSSARAQGMGAGGLLGGYGAASGFGSPGLGGGGAMVAPTGG